MSTMQFPIRKKIISLGIILFIPIIPLMWLSGSIASAIDEDPNPKPITSSEIATEPSVKQLDQTAHSFSEAGSPTLLNAPEEIFLPFISINFMTLTEAAVLDLVNQRRAEAGCGPVEGERFLREAAYLHSKDMADQRYFSHTGKNGSRFWQRAEKAGYQGFAAGENIAAGQSSAESVMNAWMNSSGHRANILNCSHTHLGIGHHYGAGSPYRNYWTQIFGRE